MRVKAQHRVVRCIAVHAQSQFCWHQGQTCSDHGAISTTRATQDFCVDDEVVLSIERRQTKKIAEDPNLVFGKGKCQEPHAPLSQTIADANFSPESKVGLDASDAPPHCMYQLPNSRSE